MCTKLRITQQVIVNGEIIIQCGVSSGFLEGSVLGPKLMTWGKKPIKSLLVEFANHTKIGGAVNNKGMSFSPA